MSMLGWAKNEVNYVLDGNYDDYYKECCKAALEVYMTLINQNHSGFSIHQTLNILNKLVDGRCLSPIEDTNDIWEKVIYNSEDKITIYQCKRMSSLFKYVYDDGTIKYNDIDRVVFIDTSSENTTWHNNICDDYVNEHYPITFPYYPSGKYKIYGRTSTLKDGKEYKELGQYNTLYLDYLILPDGERVELNLKYNNV